MLCVSRLQTAAAPETTTPLRSCAEMIRSENWRPNSQVLDTSFSLSFCMSGLERQRAEIDIGIHRTKQSSVFIHLHKHLLIYLHAFLFLLFHTFFYTYLITNWLFLLHSCLFFVYLFSCVLSDFSSCVLVCLLIWQLNDFANFCLFTYLLLFYLLSCSAIITSSFMCQ